MVFNLNWLLETELCVEYFCAIGKDCNLETAEASFQEIKLTFDVRDLNFDFVSFSLGCSPSIISP